jgi:uncharacterized membrane-anchored protein
MRAPYGTKVWAGPILYLLALLGTCLLAKESARPWAVSMIIAAAVLAVLLWGGQNWIAAFPASLRLEHAEIANACSICLELPLRCYLCSQRTFAMP